MIHSVPLASSASLGFCGAGKGSGTLGLITRSLLLVSSCDRLRPLLYAASGRSGKISLHLAEACRSGWGSLKILCRLGSAGLQVITKGIRLLVVSLLFVCSASCRVLRLAFMIDSLINLFLYPRSNRIRWSSLALISKKFVLEQIRLSLRARLQGMAVLV